MARPAQRDILKSQIAGVREAQKHLRQEGYADLWPRMVNLYHGKHFKQKSDEDRMKVNQAFAIVNVMAPAVSVSNPKFVVNARKDDAKDQAIHAETVLNYLWRQHRYQEEFRLGVKDFLIVGHAWFKVGWVATKEKVEKKLDDEVGGSGSISESHGVDEYEEGSSETERITSEVIEGRPLVERVSYDDIFVDPDARHPSEMKWIAQRIRRVLSDVKVDQRYEAAARRAISEEDSRRRIDDDDRPIDGSPDDNRQTTYVDVYEFYDIRRNEVSTFALGCEEHFLIKPQKIEFSFGHPFVMLRNYEVPDHFWPMGELESIEELQHELNETRTQMFNHRKRYTRKYLYEKEAFDQEGINALKSDDDNTMVPVQLNSSTAGQLGGVLQPMPQEATPPEFYNQSELITNDLEQVTGVSDYMRGGASDIRRTATEAAMIQDSMNARAAHKLAIVESVLSQLGQRVIQLMQQFMQGQHVARITGGPVPVWLKYDRSYIQGDFDFEVLGGSTQPRNESFRRQSALQLMDAMAPFIQMGVVNPEALLIHILRDGFDVKDPSIFLNGQPGMSEDPNAAPQGQPGVPPGMPPSAPQGVPAPPPEQMGAPLPGSMPPGLEMMLGQG